MTLYVSGYFESAASLTHYPMLKRSDTQSTFSPEDTTASSIVAEPTPRAVAVDVPGLTPMSSKRGCQHQDQHYGRQPTRQACPNCLQQVQSSPSRGIANAGRAGFDGESDSDTDSDATAADTTLGSSDTDGTSIGDATDIGVEPLVSYRADVAPALYKADMQHENRISRDCLSVLSSLSASQRQTALILFCR